MSDLSITSGLMALIVTSFAIYIHFSTKNEHPRKAN